MTVEIFKSLVMSLDPDASMTSPRIYDMVFADEAMNARATLADDDETVLTDIYVHDVSFCEGGTRRSLVRAILSINDAAVRNSNFSIGIDSRSFLVLTGRLSLPSMTATRFGEELMVWLEQAEKLRDCAQSISFDSNGVEFTSLADNSTNLGI
jgi:hypothetical protein